MKRDWLPQLRYDLAITGALILLMRSHWQNNFFQWAAAHDCYGACLKTSQNPTSINFDFLLSWSTLWHYGCPRTAASMPCGRSPSFAWKKLLLNWINKPESHQNGQRAHHHFKNRCYSAIWTSNLEDCTPLRRSGELKPGISKTLLYAFNFVSCVHFSSRVDQLYQSFAGALHWTSWRNWREKYLAPAKGNQQSVYDGSFHTRVYYFHCRVRIVYLFTARGQMCCSPISISNRQPFFIRKIFCCLRGDHCVGCFLSGTVHVTVQAGIDHEK